MASGGWHPGRGRRPGGQFTGDRSNNHAPYPLLQSWPPLVSVPLFDVRMARDPVREPWYPGEYQHQHFDSNVPARPTQANWHGGPVRNGPRGGHWRAQERQWNGPHRQNRHHGQAKELPAGAHVRLGEPMNMPDTLSSADCGFEVLGYQTFTLARPFLPVAAVPLPPSSDGKREIAVCDLATQAVYIFDSSVEGDSRERPLTALSKRHEPRKLAKPSSVAVSMDGEKIGVADNDGIHFFNVSTKQHTKSTATKNAMFGLNVHNETLFVSVDDHDSSLLFIDTEEETITTRKLGLEINRRASSHHGDYSGGRRSKFRFLGVERDETGGRRVAITDWGLNRIHVVNACSGKVNYSIGGFGTEAGKFDDPAGVAFLPGGQLAVADSKNSRVQIFGLTGSFQGFLHLPESVSRPAGLHLELEDHGIASLYVTHYDPEPGLTKLKLKFDEQ